ncbi:ABC transporter substrate-binding protein [Bifidobacterium sp.]|jgi:peptide/nickel transport system substrate-binding protein|uniref:ABC transporter substrate-binding protein n=1 Tax=Bifidobacterium sp. TaxID=41200 RepID=UPI0025C35B60|nr:ABC transporter substrate-binding protein [Bifidobacterium sp.]MCI1635446.1 ABC transporter substrate-binding protein [Bifidobacterium sp.]
MSQNIEPENSNPDSAEPSDNTSGNAEVDYTEPTSAASDITASGSTDETLNAASKIPKRRNSWLWVLIAVIVVIAVSAGAWVFSSLRSTPTATGTVAKSVTVGLKLAPTNLDIRNESGSALDQVLIGNVYQGLVARSSENKVVPAIASSWSKSDDGLTYTFKLNTDMNFSNGDVLDAKDVVWSIQELVDKQYTDADVLSTMKSITATDDNTVVITLNKPYSALLWALTGRAGLVFDKDASYDAKTQAIGSGSFLLSSFRQGDSITLTANAKYWGSAKAKTQEIIIRYFADDNAAVNALKSGDVQVLAPITENLASTFSNNDDYVVKAGDDTDKFVLAFNSTGASTSDKRVRQAIRYAINNEELIAARGGSDAALGGPIPSLDPGYEDLTDLYPYNPTKAKSLLAEAGYTTANPLKLRFEYANIYGTEIGDQLKSQLKAVGIDLQVNVVEFSAWLQDVYTNKDYDLSLVDHNESHDFYQWADPDYYYNYDNPTVQDLYAKAVAATSDTEEESYLRQAARLVSEDAPADWLFNYRVTTAYAKGVSGFPVNLNQSLLPLSNLVYVRS